MLEIIRAAWSWTGLNPAEVLLANPFGNLIIRAADDTIWRITPEELRCEQIATSLAAFVDLQTTPAFQLDWQMVRLVQLARQKLGDPTPDRCFCLKIPAVLGGAYSAENVGTLTRDELIASSGDLAYQIRDLPDGEPVRFDVIDP